MAGRTARRGKGVNGMLKIAAMLLATLAQAGLGPNLIPNPSFEKGSGGVNPAEWVRWSDGATSGLFMWDNYAGRRFMNHNSVYAARIDNMSSRGGYMSENPIPVSPDREYVLLGFLSGSQASGEIRISVRFVGDEGVLGEVFGTAVSGSTGPTAGDWVMTAFKVRPPEGATHAYIICRADYVAGSAWFEDLGLHRITKSWLDSIGFPLAGGPEVTDGTLRNDALKAMVKKRKGKPEDDFKAAFEAEAARIDEAVGAMRKNGWFWQSASCALGEARVLASVGRRDLAAGWPRRGWGHLVDAAEALKRADQKVRDGTGRPNPLPAAESAPFPLGINLVVRQPAGATEWDALMACAADFGFSEASVDFPWPLWEPGEGKFDFSGMEAIMAAAEAHGVKLFPICGPKAPLTPGRTADGKASLSSPVGWFMDKYPGAALKNSSGESIHGCSGLFWEFAFLDPGKLLPVPAWQAAWEDGLSALADRFRGRKGLGGWFVGDRPRFGQGPDDLRNITKPGLLGWNEPYLKAWRSWLESKYGSVDRLAAAWGEGAPSSFAGAMPPDGRDFATGETDPQKRYGRSPVRAADWLRFRASALAGGLRRAAGLLSAKSGVPAVPRLLPFGVTGPLDPDGLAADAFGDALRNPMAVEMITDAIPFPLLSRYQDVTLAATAAAGKGAPIWLTDYSFRRGELLGGEGPIDLLAPPYVGPYVLSAVLGGARGFFFRGLSAKPGTSSFAFPGRKGTGAITLSDEGLAVARTAQLLKALAPWLAGASPAVPRYGVIYSWTSLLNDDPQANHLLAVMNALALGGLHDVALVPEEALGSEGRVPFEVLFAPYATRMTKKAAGALQAFVERGGTLVADTYIASRDANGRFRGVLPWELNALFGVDPEGGKNSDEGLIGVSPLPAFKEYGFIIPFSLSYFNGGYRVNARKGTEVLSVYSGAKEYPAVTARKAGKGRALLFPRVRHWPEVLAEMEAARLPRPELRGLQLARQYRAYNGISCAIMLRKLLEHAGAMPRVTLVEAPISPGFLDAQARWMLQNGIPREEVEHSDKMVRESQTGFPQLSRAELVFLARSGIDLDTFAPVRVGELEGKSGGRALFVINFSSMAREALLVIKDATTATDLATGEEFAVAVGGQLKLDLKPYQPRVLALFR